MPTALTCLNLTGGVFTAQSDEDGKAFALVRDKDMPVWLEGTQKSLGFLGSDTYEQFPEQVKAGLTFEEIGVNGVRFAFAARRDRLEEVRTKMARGDTLNIVTSYPATSRECAGTLGSAVRIVATPGGSVEVAPTLMPEIDGVIDLVDSGNTLLANGLEIVRDNLQSVRLGTVWKAETKADRPRLLDIPVEELNQAIARIETRVEEAYSGARNSTTQLLVAKLREEVDELIEAFESGTLQNVAEKSADVLYPLSIMNSVRGTSVRSALDIFATDR